MCLDSFPVASQGEEGRRAVADLRATFFPPALENVMKTHVAPCLPSLPGVWLCATELGLPTPACGFSVFCISSLLLTQEQGSFHCINTGWLRNGAG